MMKRFLVFIVVALLSASVLADVPVKKHQSKAGITVLQVADETTPWIAVSFAFKNAGLKADPKNKPGLAKTIIHLMLDDQEFGLSRPSERRQLINLGVLSGFSYNVEQDDVTFSFKCPYESFPQVMALLKPYFSNPNFGGLKREQGGSYKSYLAQQMLLSRVFPEHPYGETDMKGSVHSTTQEDAMQSFKQRFAKDNLVFSVVGAGNIKQVIKVIDDTFQALPEKAQLPKVADTQPDITSNVVVIEKKTSQTAVGFVHPSVKRQHEDYYKLRIVNDILGGQAFTSRLWKAIREEQGLVYHIQTRLLDFDHASLMYGEFETRNELVARVIASIREQWQLLTEQGISREEFKLAKSSLMGRMALNYTSPESISATILDNYLLGYPFDYINQRNKDIEKITFEDINQTIKKHYTLDRLLFVAVGDPQLESGES